MDRAKYGFFRWKTSGKGVEIEQSTLRNLKFEVKSCQELIQKLKITRFALHSLSFHHLATPTVPNLLIIHVKIPLNYEL